MGLRGGKIKMSDTQKILRNWKMVWTIIAIIFSIFILQMGVKYNSCFGENGWNVLKIDSQENDIGHIAEYTISVDSASSIWFHIIVGLVGFFVIQLLHIFIWIGRCWVIQ